VLVGDSSHDTAPLAAVVGRHYRPFAVQIPLTPGEPQRALAAAMPWLEMMTKKDGRATAYVCRDFACLQPTADPEELDRQLSMAGPSRIILA